MFLLEMHMITRLSYITPLPSNGLQHSVTQSSFENPCTPLAANATSGEPAGFNSGFQADAQFSITITNDQIRKFPTIYSEFSVEWLDPD